MANARDLFERIRDSLGSRWQFLGEGTEGWLTVPNDPAIYTKGYINPLKELCEKLKGYPELKDHPKIDELVKSANALDEAVLDAMRKKQSGKLRPFDIMLLEEQLKNQCLGVMKILRTIDIQQKVAPVPPPKPRRLSPDEQAAILARRRPPAVPPKPSRPPGSTSAIAKEMGKTPLQPAPAQPTPVAPTKTAPPASTPDYIKKLSVEVRGARKQLEKSLKKFQKDTEHPGTNPAVISSELTVIARNFVALQQASEKAEKQKPIHLAQDDPQIKKLDHQIHKANKLIRRIRHLKATKPISAMVDINRVFENIISVKNAVSRLHRYQTKFDKAVAASTAPAEITPTKPPGHRI